MPVLLMIMISIMELGASFYVNLSAGQSSREGARVAALAGDDIDADCAVLQAMGPFLSQHIDSLQNVQIFKVNPAGNQIPGKTNTYWFTSGDPSDCTRWAGFVSWPSTTRNVTVGPGQQLDIIGVRVRVDGQWMTGFPPYNGAYLVDEQSVNRMEPEAYA